MEKSNYKTISVFNVCISECLGVGNMSQWNVGRCALYSYTCVMFSFLTKERFRHLKCIQVSMYEYTTPKHRKHICHSKKYTICFLRLNISWLE